jgi:hypothetical protein
LLLLQQETTHDDELWLLAWDDDNGSRVGVLLQG